MVLILLGKVFRDSCRMLVCKTEDVYSGYGRVITKNEILGALFLFKLFLYINYVVLCLCYKTKKSFVLRVLKFSDC